MESPWSVLIIGARIGMLASTLALGPSSARWLVQLEDSGSEPDGDPIATFVEPSSPPGLPDPICVECRIGTTLSAEDPHVAEIIVTWDDASVPVFEGSMYAYAVLHDGSRHRVTARPGMVVQLGETHVVEVLDDPAWSWQHVDRLELAFVVD